MADRRPVHAEPVSEGLVELQRKEEAIRTQQFDLVQQMSDCFVQAMAFKEWHAEAVSGKNSRKVQLLERELRQEADAEREAALQAVRKELIEA